MLSNNDILRRLRYALRINNRNMLAVFQLSGYEIPEEHLQNLLKKEEEPGFISCRDSVLLLFLDGLILERRGPSTEKRAAADEPNAEAPRKPKLNYNDVLRKIRIALELQEQDLIDIMALAGFTVSRSELSAFFRKPGHRNYRECGGQFLRNFLRGLTLRYRGEPHV